MDWRRCGQAYSEIAREFASVTDGLDLENAMAGPRAAGEGNGGMMASIKDHKGMVEQEERKLEASGEFSQLKSYLHQKMNVV